MIMPDPTPFCPNTRPSGSRSGSFIEVEQPAKVFATADVTGRVRIGTRGKGNEIAEPLVISLGVIMLDEVRDHSVQMTLAQ